MAHAPSDLARPAGFLFGSYEVSLLLKALLGLTQLASALMLHLTPNVGVTRFVTWLTSQEL